MKRAQGVALVVGTSVPVVMVLIPPMVWRSDAVFYRPIGTNLGAVYWPRLRAQFLPVGVAIVVAVILLRKRKVGG